MVNFTKIIYNKVLNPTSVFRHGTPQTASKVNKETKQNQGYVLAKKNFITEPGNLFLNLLNYRSSHIFNKMKHQFILLRLW